MHYFMDLNSFGQAHLAYKMTEGRWGVLGATQPEHITHLRYILTTLTLYIFPPNPIIITN